MDSLENIKNYNSVTDFIRKKDMVNNQNSIALEYFGTKITRRDYWKCIDKYRNYFTRIGIEEKEPVAICMLNCPEYEFMFLSLLENGSIAATVSKAFLNADIRRQTIDRGIKTLVLNVEFLPELLKHKTFEQFDEDSLDRIILTTANTYMALGADIRHNDDFTMAIRKLKEVPSLKNTEIICPEELKKAIESTSDLVLPRKNVINNVATYSNTGGTTGAPKCAYHTHRGVISILMSHDRDIYKEFDMKEHSRSLLSIPISHITSQFYALLIRRTYGANIIYNPSAFDPLALREELIKENIDDVVLPFGLYYAITRYPFKEGELKINTPLCGGEPTPKMPVIDVDNQFRIAGSNRIIIGTGSTEFGSGIMASYGIEDRTNESGYFFPFAKGFIIDPKTGEKIEKEGKRGILYANAPWQMEGYLNDPESTCKFYNLTDTDGTVYGTNNDIVEIVGEHNGKTVYSMLGRTSDFVLKDKNKYYPGVSFKDNKIVPVDFEEGKFLFDLRDVLLNIKGIKEVQPIIITLNEENKKGYPVLNVTIMPGYTPVDILKTAYTELNKTDFVPEGIIFRTRFERSLSSDKREVISLIDERTGYYTFDGKDIYSVSFPKDGEPIKKIYKDEILEVEPPAPKLVFSNRHKK